MLNLQGSKILNPDLKDLLAKDNIPMQILSKLEELKIYSLSDLSYYRKKNGSFCDIFGCDEETDALLLDFCLQYDDNLSIDTKFDINNADFWKSIPNFSLDDLVGFENLTKRSFTVCSKYKLLTLQSIIQFYLKYGNFQKLVSVGIKSNEELILVCEKYIQFAKDRIRYEQELGYKDEKAVITSTGIMVAQKESQGNCCESDLKTIDANISIEQLASIERMSIRSLNVCRFAGINALKDLVQFKEDNSTFLKLKNSGKKTNEELLRIAEKYNHILTKTNKNDATITVYDLIASFTDTQLHCLINITKQKISKLSKRAETILNQYIGIDTSTQEFFNRLSSFEPKSYKNNISIGTRTISELESFILEVHDDAMNIVNKDEQTIVQEQKVQLYSNFYQINEEEMQILFSKTHHLSYFSFIDHCINNSHKLKKSHKAVFDLFYKNKSKQINEIAGELHLTRERIRQLCAKIQTMFFSDFIPTDAWSKTKMLDCINQVLDVTTELISLDSVVLKTINDKNEVNYNYIFFSRLFTWLLEDSHTQILQKERKLCNTYFVSNKYSSLFDFDKCVKDMQLFISERIEEDCVINMDGYVYGFMKLQNLDYFENIKHLIGKIIYNEFSGLIGIDVDGNLVFYKNTYESKTDSLCKMIIEILEKEGSPMTVKQLRRAILNINSSLLPSNSDEYIRSILNKNRDIFAPLGRTSTYGLYIWEKQRSNFKGGSIRRIVKEFLSAHAEPKHIYDIFSFVKQYRPLTTLRSVESNIAVDSLNTFIKFSGGFWGLAEISYSPELLNFKPIPPSIMRLVKSILKKYRAVKYNRMVTFLSNYYQLKEIQIIAYLNQSIEAKKLVLTDDAIFVFQQNLYRQC